tara:strand:- start:322 stop:543 length:222 start_codon:yes stop_codon:yes gene_type:complete
MIKIGDIVFMKSSGGIVKRVDQTKIGLVIECYNPPGTLPQYKVSFPDGTVPRWWEGRYLQPIDNNQSKGSKEK